MLSIFTLRTFRENNRNFSFSIVDNLSNILQAAFVSISFRQDITKSLLKVCQSDSGLNLDNLTI